MRDARHPDADVGIALRDRAAGIELSGDFPVVARHTARIDIAAAKMLVEQAACARAGGTIRESRLFPRKIGGVPKAEWISVRDQPSRVRRRNLEKAQSLICCAC